MERLASFIGWNKTGGLADAINFLSIVDASEIARAQFDTNFLLPEDRMKGVRAPYGPVVESKSSGFMTTEPRLRARNSWSKNIPVVLSNAADEALLLRSAAAAKGDSLLSSIDFANLIPYDTGRSFDESERESLGRKIRNFYFSDETANEEKLLNDYIKMETDRLYVHGESSKVLRFPLSLLRSSRYRHVSYSNITFTRKSTTDYVYVSTKRRFTDRKSVSHTQVWQTVSWNVSR